jgi:glycosyltransferase involved in cell wall biosynthesis
LTADLVVTFEAPIPQRALRERLSRADAGIVPTRLNGMTRFSLSNKLLEYVHLGMPVLAARLPSYEHYLGEDSAWYWTPADAEDLARTIERLAAASVEERSNRATRAQHNLEPIRPGRTNGAAGRPVSRPAGGPKNRWRASAMRWPRTAIVCPTVPGTAPLRCRRDGL